MKPNWKLLTAFEAAARHRSFTRAAAELNVQQPAISRRVAMLEAQLGVRLLHRTRPQATLTGEGGILFEALSVSFQKTRDALAQIQLPESSVVTVNTTIGFASCYLMKRLPAFRSAYPDISVELVSRDQNDGYVAQAADVIVVFNEPDSLPGARQKRIFPETLVAVAKPGIVPDFGEDLERLASEALLHLTLGIHGNDWRRFFEGTGIAPPPPPSDRRFTSFMVYLQAALNGDGIALGWETLMKDQIEMGQLRPVAARRVRTKRGYFACIMPRAEANPNAVKLWEWMSSLGK